MRIVNGRFGTESKRTTCKDASVVDYALMSSNLLTEVLKFSVGLFDPLLSDTHNALSLDLQNTVLGKIDDAELIDMYDSERGKDASSIDSICTEKVKWKAELQDRFREDLDLDKL